MNNISNNRSTDSFSEAELNRINSCIDHYAEKNIAKSLLFRTVNAVKALFGRSEYQIAKRILESHSINAMNTWSSRSFPENLVTKKQLSNFALKTLIASKRILGTPSTPGTHAYSLAQWIEAAPTPREKLARQNIGIEKEIMDFIREEGRNSLKLGEVAIRYSDGFRSMSSEELRELTALPPPFFLILQILRRALKILISLPYTL